MSTNLEIRRRLLAEPGGPVLLADALLPWIENAVAIAEKPGMRWPVVRRGERDTIPPLTRRLVLRRDNEHCKTCASDYNLQLDHIVPWSHGGTDRSDNLRTLCEYCNNARSNYLEMHLPRVVGVVAVCDPCLAIHDNKMINLHDRSGLWFECPYCRAFPALLGDGHVPAYCATCDFTSWVSDPARIL